MAIGNIYVTVNVIIWFYNGKYGFFTIDDITNDIVNVTEQLIAESMGLA